MPAKSSGTVVWVRWSRRGEDGERGRRAALEGVDGAVEHVCTVFESPVASFLKLFARLNQLGRAEPLSLLINFLDNCSSRSGRPRLTMAETAQEQQQQPAQQPTYTRRRRTPTPPPPDPYALLDEDESAPLYVPLKQRRAQLVSKLAAKGTGGAAAAAEKRKREEIEEDEKEREREEEEARRKKREAQTLLMEAQEVKRQKALEGESLPFAGWRWRIADFVRLAQSRPRLNSRSAKKKRPKSLRRKRRLGRSLPERRRSQRASSTRNA